MNTCMVPSGAINELGEKCLEAAPTLKFESRHSMFES